MCQRRLDFLISRGSRFVLTRRECRIRSRKLP